MAIFHLHMAAAPGVLVVLRRLQVVIVFRWSDCCCVQEAEELRDKIARQVYDGEQAQKAARDSAEREAQVCGGLSRHTRPPVCP